LPENYRKTGFKFPLLFGFAPGSFLPRGRKNFFSTTLLLLMRGGQPGIIDNRNEDHAGTRSVR
jgi:hypothetical protein